MDAIDFLNRIITKGQQYNLAFGFLSLTTPTVQQEQQVLANLLKSNTSRASK